MSAQDDLLDAAERQIRQQTENTVQRICARQARHSARPSAPECEECGSPIPEERQRAVPGVQTCIECARDEEARSRHYAHHQLPASAYLHRPIDFQRDLL